MFDFCDGIKLLTTIVVKKLFFCFDLSKCFSDFLKRFSRCSDCFFFSQTEMVIHVLVIKTPLSIYAWIYKFEEGGITLTSHLIEPITAICLTVNHPSCSNSFCVLSQSAFRPHTHISIAFKVRCTSLHFIPPSLHSFISPFFFSST